jgi:hypothetical protein
MCPNKKQILLVDDAYVLESEDEMPELEDDTNKDDGKSIDCWPHLNVASLMAHKVQRDDKLLLNLDNGVAFFKQHVPSRENFAN